MTRDNYTRITAIVNHAAIKMAIEKTFPEASNEEQDNMILLVIERMARMRGYAIRREFSCAEEDE